MREFIFLDAYANVKSAFLFTAKRDILQLAYIKEKEIYEGKGEENFKEVLPSFYQHVN